MDKKLERLCDELVMAAVTVRRKRLCEPGRLGKALEELWRLLEDRRWPRRRTIKEAFA